MNRYFTLLAASAALAGQAMAADAAKTTSSSPKAAQPRPTLANVHYGEHERQVLDFWQATSTQPTPVVFHIHGGGWVTGDKATVAALESYLAAGISVVSINYRYVSQAIKGGAKPPVQWPLSD